MTLDNILIILALLVGAFTRTVFGFGEALVTMPLLMLLGTPLDLSVALVGALGLTVAIPAAASSRLAVDWHVVRRLVLGSLLGVPVGVLLIKLGSPHVVVTCLGVLLILVGGWNMVASMTRQRQEPVVRSHRWDYVAGLVAGVLGSAYNSHGVPVAIYGTLRRWGLNEQRGILQAHFVCVGTLVVASQLTAGLWSMRALYLLLATLPLLLVVIPLGNWVVRHTGASAMQRLVYGVFLVFGVLMLFK